MSGVLHADAGGSLIGLIVLVLWVIGNIASAASRKKRPPGFPPADGTSPEVHPPLPPLAPTLSPEDELRQFFEQLTKQARAPRPPPEPAAAPEPAPVPEAAYVPPPPPLRARAPDIPRPPPARVTLAATLAALRPQGPPPLPEAPLAAEMAAAPLPPADLTAVMEEAAVEATKHPHARQAAPIVAKTPAIALPHFRLGTASAAGWQALGPHGPLRHPALRALHQRRGLKHAFVLQMALDPPRSLRPYTEGEGYARTCPPPPAPPTTQKDNHP